MRWMKYIGISSNNNSYSHIIRVPPAYNGPETTSLTPSKEWSMVYLSFLIKMKENKSRSLTERLYYPSYGHCAE